jgi:hypothetical protein
MEELARWGCEQLGFSACYALSPLEIYQGGEFLLISVLVGRLPSDLAFCLHL